MSAGFPIYSFIVARTRNRVIGCENKMPWHLPTDLKNFKRITLGKPIIMGRRTFDSLGCALPGRPNIVVSREGGILAPGVMVAKDKATAMRFAELEAVRLGVDEVVVIGGEAIFALFEREVQRVYLTEIDADIDGDTYFKSEFEDWHVSNTRKVQKGKDGDEYAFEIRQFDRPLAGNLSTMTAPRCLAVA